MVELHVLVKIEKDVRIIYRLSKRGLEVRSVRQHMLCECHNKWGTSSEISKSFRRSQFKCKSFANTNGAQSD